MSEQKTVTLGNGTPEEIAYKLMRDISAHEASKDRTQLDKNPRDYILGLYADCLLAAKGFYKKRGMTDSL